MPKERVDITCTQCGSVSKKRKDNVQKTLLRGGNLFCSNACVLSYRNPQGTPAERLERGAKANPNTGCIEWVGYTRGGYGSLRIDGKQLQAHRVAYEISKGPIPEGLFVCHKCDNRRCINIEHLFLGTNKDNVDDMVNKRRHNFGDKHPNTVVTKKVKDEMVPFVASGITVLEIAKRLGIKYGTAKHYVAAIRKNLRQNNCPAAR